MKRITLMRIATIVALLLPLLAAVGAIIWQERALARAAHWAIPVSDISSHMRLRGQTLTFRWDWRLEGDAVPCLTTAECDLCLARDGETIVALVAPAGGACAARVDVQASRMRVRPGEDGGPPWFESQLRVSEASVPAMDAQMRRGPMVAEATLGEDGRLLARRLRAR